MNKEQVRQWLLSETKKNAGKFNPKRRRDLEDALYEIKNRREVKLPSNLPKGKDKMVRVLRKHFKNDVSLISLVLNHYYPDDFLFYRVSQLEEEIFDGLDFLGPGLPFDRVGKMGFERYLELNNALLKFAKQHWPNLSDPQRKVHYFLYQGLGNLFLERSNYNRYWVLTTKASYFDSLNDRKTTWSGRKEMKSGDLVFMYRMDPIKAIKDIWRVEGNPKFNPWGAWGGWNINLKLMVRIEDIPFSDMRIDPVMKKWSVIKKQFHGVISEPIPHSIYNRLLTKLPGYVKRMHKLQPEQVLDSEYSGQFGKESDFDEDFIKKLLKEWHFKYQYQHPIKFCVGTQSHHCRVDFLVSDEKGPLTIFENKLRIINERDLKPAVDQARSYALLLSLPSFVVASPEKILREPLIIHFSSTETC